MRSGDGEEIDALFNLSQILECGLDRRTLAVILELMEAGVHPESLVDIIKECRPARSSN
jgi:mitotic-spindle organizing protein 1